ncbi:YbfB/YjiJ family MFS transporter [Erwinia aphidicola]|jgi:MFS family permease|uniref:YbfB/YjiJ family MFS transporter n=1 Tax=Erwinia aphidicola TaxID=68334 RepID=A0ABU8DI27_ERWAP|nr:MULTISPECIES: YbfB/YjiJ family MFS transporter [Erwinia]KYP85280.1 MFS transporter [bacteria symbiont BFo1 of Frankliniella occidentalis]KYP90699.1 MFS transporter [bacteria symbiont BFo1 of Frankliniella occidentalis]MBD1375599.1 YbfB/YjiJ family MFS transporter [Erwinia aphidicola]MCP2229731.1 MFS family permease [Erwinia aphidicola]MDI3439361.1 YbfB/YjiJ family MFS transporter [Erwinia sp. V90_4]
MAVRVAFSAFLALVVAMGIGRFAFTPQVPLMIAEHQLSLTSAAVVAALNYLGYLCGSFDAMRATRRVEWRLQAGIWGAVLLTLLSACVSGPWLHGVVRFLIGWASGWGMVLIAAWSNEQLHRYQRPGLSAAVFAGPGTGIFISGMLAVGLHSLQVSAAWAWAAYGVLALILVALIARTLPRTGQLHRPDIAPEPLRLTTGLKRLVWSYSLAGFGYILPATFLAQMATTRFPGLISQFVWPVFGGAAVIGIVIGILTRHLGSSNRRLALVLWVQALGVFASDLLPGLGGLALGAALVGGGFLCVVQLSLQYARELAPQHTRYLAGLLTTGYAVGQLVGPLLSAASTALTHRLEPALYVAGVALLIAGLLVWQRDAMAE